MQLTTNGLFFAHKNIGGCHSFSFLLAQRVNEVLFDDGECAAASVLPCQAVPESQTIPHYEKDY